VTFRFIQGLGGALLVTAQTIITESYPIAKSGTSHLRNGCDCRTYARPTIGGYIVDRFSWPYIFYINIPLGSSQPLTLSFVRSPKYGEKLKSNQVDWLGIILLASFIGSLQFVLEHGQQDDWFNNKLIVLLSAVSVFGVILFIWRQLTYKYPIVNLSVLKDGNLRLVLLWLLFSVLDCTDLH
jgi:DHA2 family multidrug resistance protein